jgi:hypothetical protein
MKRILAITSLNFFVSGGLTLVIPLLLLEREISLVQIGLIISVLPLVFLTVRLLLALIVDVKGWNRIYLLLNWPATLLATCLYFLASSTSLLLFGKVAEAVKESSYFAANRTAIFSLSPGREGREATRNTAVGRLSTAAGSAAVGVGIAYFGFSATLGLLVVAAGIIGVPAALLWNVSRQHPSPKPNRIGGLINLRNYGRRFWLVSITLLFLNLAFYPLLGLLIPVFMAQQLGYGYITIGIAYMAYSLVTSSIIFSTLRLALGAKRVVFQSSIALFAAILLAYSNAYFLIPFFMLAIAEGLGTGFFESVIAKATKSRASVSVDIGLLHVPMRFAEFASLLYAGFIAENIGFAPVFASCGIFFATFSILSFYLLRHQQLKP